jgi:hypothetical protein
VDVLRLGFATAAFQPQRGCNIQPSVAATKERLRWVANENESNSEGVVATGNRTAKYAKYAKGVLR